MSLRDPRSKASNHGQPRSGDPSNSKSHGDVTDVFGDLPNQVTKEILIPAIANRTRNAINVDRREVFLYQKLRAGRQCSCWNSGESSPSSLCSICHSTGYAGGYYKWGTDLYLFDPTAKWTSVNVVLNYNFGSPPWFSLEDESKFGYIEWEVVPEKAKYYGLDSYIYEYRKKGGSIDLSIKLDGLDSNFIKFTQEQLKQRILMAEGRTLRFRVTMKRTTLAEESPLFLQFWFRALINSPDYPVLYVDIPRRQEGNALAEYGIQETFNQVQFVFSDAVQRINQEDLIIRLHDMTRWKVIENSVNDPQNIVTSHDIQARKVNLFEALNLVPM